MKLTALDRYGVRAAIEGKHEKWRSLPLSEHIKALLENVVVSGGISAFQKALTYMVDAQTLVEISRVDTDEPPPSHSSQPTLPASDVPQLPSHVRLTDKKQQQIAALGAWQREYVAWASRRANETPISFHEGASLFLGGVAIGRRCYINAPWGEAVFPNLYIMFSAISTYYRKTAALRLATQVARSAIPHMILPEPGSPENFINMLAGIVDLDSLKPADKARFERGLPFAAQRAIIRDEISGLFKSMGRDYMSGMKERIMQMYDCPPYIDISTNSRGIVTARDVALSILGAATPAELRIALMEGDWHNGTLARFALVTPEVDYSERPMDTELSEPTDLIYRLKRMHEALPQPVANPLDDQSSQSESWSLIAPKPEAFWKEVKGYEQALRDLTRRGSGLEDALRALYGRLHVHALKVAIILAAQDWADGGAAGRPEVTLPYWWRAVEIVEGWRASAHRFKDELSESLETIIEERILAFLGRGGQQTARAIYRTLHMKARDCTDALDRLHQAGLVAVFEAQQAGQSKVLYGLV